MLPLAKTTWDDREVIEMLKVINRGQYATGEKVEKFEKNMPNMIDQNIV